MLSDSMRSDQHCQGSQRCCPPSYARIVLGPSGANTPPDQRVAPDPAREARWLQSLTSPSAPPWQQRLADAIGLVADELERGPGLVELIVAPSSWHGWVDYVIVRPLREGHSASLQVLSLSPTELSIYSWRKPEAAPEPPHRRQRVQRPVRLYFDLAQVVEPAAPTRQDLLVYVTHGVRERYAAIERV